MEVTDELVDKLAKLSHLQFEGEEKQQIKADLQRMITFFDKVSEIDVTGVEPLVHMTHEINILRDDKVQGQVSTEDALKNARVHDGTYFQVPKAINRDK